MSISPIFFIETSISNALAYNFGAAQFTATTHSNVYTSPIYPYPQIIPLWKNPAGAGLIVVTVCANGPQAAQNPLRGADLGEDLPAQRQIAHLMGVRDSMRREIGSQQKYLEA